MPLLPRLSCCLLAAVVLLVVDRAEAQRTEFPSTISTPPAFNTLPTAPPAAPLSPAAAPPYGAAPPAATFNGTIQPAGPPLDPYADPSLQGTGAYQPGTAGQQANSSGYLFPQPDGTTGEWPRFLQQLRLRYTWLDGSGSKANDLEMNNAEVDGTFVIPFLYNQNAPLLVTPGFAVDFTQGPQSSTGADLPPRLYEAYLDLGWRPHLTDRFSVDLGFRAGVYSDFDYFASRSIRYLGRAYGVYTWSPALELRFGAIYLDRLHTRLLPAGGVVWTPDADTRWEILFPNPKLSQRLTTFGNTDVWWYVAGELGGGTWTIDRPVVGHDQVEYDDLRVMVGLDWIGHLSVRGFTEVGYVWDRKLEYRSDIGNFDPKPTIMLRGGIAF